MPDLERVRPVALTPRGEAVVPARQRRHPTPLLVFGGIPGEEIDVRVSHVGGNRAYGMVHQVIRPSPDRVDPPCDRFVPCGGCPLMHMTPAAQRAARRQLVVEALEESGLKVPVAQVVPCPDGEAGFRHVVKVGVGYSDHGRLRVGAWSRNTRNVVPVPECVVAAPILRKVMASLAHHVIQMDLRPYEPEHDRGLLRSAVLRASRTTGEVLVTLVAARRNRALVELAEALAGSVSEVVGVWLHVNDEEGNAIFTRGLDGSVPVTPLVGKDSIEEVIGGVRYGIGPGDFFQTAPGVAEVMYQRVVERLGLERDVPVVDLYCGVGGMALQAAKVTGWALGVESVDGAVQRAREGARRNGINAEFIADEVEVVLPDLAKRLKGIRPVVLVNPARRGLEDGVIEGILALQPRRIAYVSCNPRALARDLLRFQEAGYTVGEVEPFDMFPHTSHVETLVVLEAPESAEAAARSPRRKVVRK